MACALLALSEFKWPSNLGPLLWLQNKVLQSTDILVVFMRSYHNVNKLIAQLQGHASPSVRMFKY